jgi:hypothetical protein
MKRIGYKQAVINTCIELIETNIESTYSLIKEIEQSAAEYGPPKDRYDSFRTQLSRRREGLVQQILKGEEELKILRKIDQGRSFDHVEFGALVIIEKQKILIGAGIGKFDYLNETYMAVSFNVPIVQAMLGLKKGDYFEFRNEKTQILDIY